MPTKKEQGKQIPKVPPNPVVTQEVPPAVPREKPKYIKPRKFTVEYFQQKTDEYIKLRQQENRPITKVGLALFIGCDSDTITNLSAVDGYSEAIKSVVDAGLQFEVDFIHSGKNPAGAIFLLKNLYGWTDKQEIVNTGTVLHRLELPETKQIDAAAVRLLADRKTIQGEFTPVE